MDELSHVLINDTLPPCPNAEPNTDPIHFADLLNWIEDEKPIPALCPLCRDAVVENLKTKLSRIEKLSGSSYEKAAERCSKLIEVLNNE